MHTVLLRYAHRGPLHWSHIETLPDDGRLLAHDPYEVDAGQRPPSLTIRATVSADIRPIICAWELYGCAPAQVPLRMLGEFETARRQVWLDYNLGLGPCGQYPAAPRAARAYLAPVSRVVYPPIVRSA